MTPAELVGLRRSEVQQVQSYALRLDPSSEEYRRCQLAIARLSELLASDERRLEALP